MARRKDYRARENVRSVVLRMGEDFIDMLDDLCDVNDRSRRQIVEAMTEKEHAAHAKDNKKRITV